MKSSLLWTVLTLWLLVIPSEARQLQVEPTWSVLPQNYASSPPSLPSRRQINVILIKIFDPKDLLFEGTPEDFNLAHPAFTSDKFWRLTATSDGKEKVLPHRVFPNVSPKTKIVRLFLILDKPPVAGPVYKVVPAEPDSLAGILRSGHRLIKIDQDKLQKAEPESGNLAKDLAYVAANEGVKTNISFKTGDKNTAKLELFTGFDGWAKSSDWRFQAHALAEGTYRPKESEKALSKILGEIEYLHTTDLGFSKDPFLAAVWQIGGVARIESDQEFDNVEGSIGASSWLALNGRLLHSTADILCLNGDAPTFAAPLLLNLSYTYVQKMESGSAIQGFHDDTHRLNGKIYWSFTLLRDLHLERISPKLDTYNLNVVINSGFAYDFRLGEMFPDIEASLELTPQTEGGKGKPSLVLTYKNGKTTTRAENYDALLAGIKIPF